MDTINVVGADTRIIINTIIIRQLPLTGYMYGKTVHIQQRSDYCRSGGLKAKMFHLKTKVYE